MWRLGFFQAEEIRSNKILRQEQVWPIQESKRKPTQLECSDKESGWTKGGEVSRGHGNWAVGTLGRSLNVAFFPNPLYVYK